MPMGSISSILHGTRRAHQSALTWEFTSKIALEAAYGVDYLHSLVPNLSHSNIKSSNIFLTNQNHTHVSKFGIIQLLSPSVPVLNDYCAPEVTSAHKISQKGGVYSFGILLLELLTGKVPTVVLKEEGMELTRWVESVVEEKWTIDVFDNQLLSYQNMEKQMLSSCILQFLEEKWTIDLWILSVSCLKILVYLSLVSLICVWNVWRGIPLFGCFWNLINENLNLAVSNVGSPVRR